MIDVQNQRLVNSKAIEKVGVRNIRYPLVVMDKNQGKQATVADVSMFVSLPREYRGTHMSRFVEILNQYRGCISRSKIRELLKQMKLKLNAEASHIEISFPYFIEKAAPVSGITSLMNYHCRWLASEDHLNVFRQDLEVRIPVMNLCPCSKELTQCAAHNQRGNVIVRISSNHLHWIEDIVELVESCASSPVYTLLKREDEKYVSETAYANPRFVEDIVRGVALKLEQMPDLVSYKVEAENYESIHNHDAYAMICGHPTTQNFLQGEPADDSDRTSPC